LATGLVGEWEVRALWDWIFLFWLLIFAAIIAAVVWVVRSQRGNRTRLLERRSDSLEIVEERYARGEIDRDEYLQKKRDLSD